MESEASSYVFSIGYQNRGDAFITKPEKGLRSGLTLLSGSCVENQSLSSHSLTPSQVRSVCCKSCHESQFFLFHPFFSPSRSQIVIMFMYLLIGVALMVGTDAAAIPAPETADEILASNTKVETQFLDLIPIDFFKGPRVGRPNQTPKPQAAPVPRQTVKITDEILASNTNLDAAATSAPGTANGTLVQDPEVEARTSRRQKRIVGTLIEAFKNLVAPNAPEPQASPVPQQTVNTQCQNFAGLVSCGRSGR